MARPGPKSRREVAHWPLAPAENRFVEEYLVDLDVDSAAERAGLEVDRARRALGEVRVQNALRRARTSRASRTQIYGDEVVRRWWLLANADARELQQVRFVNCRYCWGLDHRFQFRDHELQEARARHLGEMMTRPPELRVEFDDLGGGGFQGQKDPCRGPGWAQTAIDAGADTESTLLLVNSTHDCPACDGLGERFIWTADSRTLSPAAAMLYNGISISKEGKVTINLRDRDHALTQLAKHLGVLDRVQKSVNVNLDPTQLTDEQLEAALQQFGRLTGHGGLRPGDDAREVEVIDHDEDDGV
jgi:phage terminase small subunit